MSNENLNIVSDINRCIGMMQGIKAHEEFKLQCNSDFGLHDISGIGLIDVMDQMIEVLSKHVPDYSQQIFKTP